MAASSTLQVLIDIKSQLSGLETAVAQMRQLKAETAATASVGSTLQSVIAGFAGGIAASAVSELSRIPAMLTAAITDGVRFNATLESSQLGIAAIVKQFDQSGRIKNFDDAIAASTLTLNILRSQAKQTAATFEELVQGFQANAGPLFQAGINNAKQQVDVVVAASQAMSALAIPTNQLNQELRALFQGDVSRNSRLNQVLQITKEEIDAAVNSGTAYQLLMERLASFAEAGARAQDTFNTRLSNLSDITTELKAAGTASLFEAIRVQLGQLNDYLSRPEAAEAAAGWGAVLAGVLKRVQEEISNTQRDAQELMKLWQRVHDAGKALFSFVPGQSLLFSPEQKGVVSPFDVAGAERFRAEADRINTAITEAVRSAASAKEIAAAQVDLEKQRAELVRRTKDESALIRHEAEIQLQLLDSLAGSFGAIRDAAAATAGSMRATSAEIDGIIKKMGALQAIQLETAGLAAKAGGDDGAVFENEKLRVQKELTAKLIDEGTAQGQIVSIVRDRIDAMTTLRERELSKQRESLQLSESEKQATILRASGREGEANTLDRTVRIQREIKQLEDAGEKDHERAVTLATQHVDATIQLKNAKSGAATASKAENQTTSTYLREQSSLMQGIRQQQQLINESPFLSIDQKQSALLQLAREQIAALNDEVARGRALISGGTLDPATYEQVLQKIQQARFEIELLSQKTQTLSFGGELKSDLVQWANNFGTAAHQVGQAITGSINTALDATTELLTDAIFRTGNWKQTVLQAEKAIVGSLIKIGLQMLVQKAISTFITRSTTQEQTQSGAQIAAAHAPAAAATSISSSGTSAIVGAIAAAAAIAAIIALLVGFEHGGYTGYGGTKQIAGVVHGQEFVHPKLSVDYYGVQFHEALRLRKIPVEQIQGLIGNYRYNVTPRLGSFDTGGAVAAVEASATQRQNSPGASRAPVINQAFFDSRKDARAWAESLEGETWLVDMANRNSHRIG